MRFFLSVLAVTMMVSCADREFTTRYYWSDQRVEETSDPGTEVDETLEQLEAMDTTVMDLQTYEYIIQPGVTLQRPYDLSIEQIEPVSDEVVRLQVTAPLPVDAVSGLYDISYFAQEPIMILSLFRVGDPDGTLSHIAQTYPSLDPVMVTLGEHVYYRAAVPGLVNITTYYLVVGDWFFHIMLKGYPTQLVDDQVRQQVNQDFMTVLQSLRVEED